MRSTPFSFARATEQGGRPCIAGIVNVTPDSFSDGGRFLSPEAAETHARQLIADGADMLDIGAQSTRPGYTEITPEQEWTRLSPVLERLCGQVDVPISVDTYFPAVGELALRAGAAVLNDVSGDPQGRMAVLAAEYGAGLILNCPLGGDGQDVIEVTRRWFVEAWERCRRAGLSERQICLDPGIGFGTTREEDVRLLERLPELTKDLPQAAVLVGVSRKRVTAYVMRDTLPEEIRRERGTARLQRLAWQNGADWLRVHDVGAAVAMYRRESDAQKGTETYG